MTIIKCDTLRIPFIIAILMVFIFINAGISNAETRQTNTNTPAAGNSFVFVSGKFYKADVQKILALINHYRWEACVNGYPNPSNTGGARLTRNDYKPIKWSGDLEWIAQTRAAEASLQFSHTRPNGKSCFDCVYNGVRMNGEALASNWALPYGQGLENGIMQWYKEKYDWVNQTGGITGHYTAMISPSSRAVGIGCFYADEGSWVCVAGEFSYDTNLSQASKGVNGRYDQKMEVLNSSLSAPYITGNSTVYVGSPTSYVLRRDAFNQTVKVVASKWSTTNTGIATISSTGKITPIKAGKVTVNATASDGKTASKSITVTKRAGSVGKTTIRNTIANSAKRTNDVIFDKVPGATSYDVAWKASSSNSWVIRNRGSKPRATIGGLTIGGLYDIKVRARKAETPVYKAATGQFSPVVHRYFYTLKKIRLTSSKKGSFTMSWAKDNKSTSYQVLFTTNKNGAGAANNIRTTTGTSMTVSGLKSGQTYYVQVRAIRKAGGVNYIGNISVPVGVRVK